MLDLNIEISGHSQNDLELALEEVLRLVKAGMLSGMNSNDTGDFSFQITGEEEAENEESGENAE